jgi:hypothetical protein
MAAQLVASRVVLSYTGLVIYIYIYIYSLLSVGSPGAVSQHEADHGLELITNIQPMIKSIILPSLTFSCHGAWP